MIDLNTDQLMKLRTLGVLKISYGDQSMDMPELEVHDTASTEVDSEFHGRYNKSSK